jgi:hypothetical protein
MAKKVKVERFDAVDKARIVGRVKHTRTGACTASGRCYHGMKKKKR